MSERRPLAVGFVVALTAILASGCALTSRGDAIQWQYFTPERARPALESAKVTAGPEVCLERVTSSASSGRRIAHSDGGHRVGYYEDRRWTDDPEGYVRRALERTLFEEEGFRCDREASSSRLDVEVLGFEEVRTPASHAARVALRAVLATSAENTILDETIEVVEPVTGSTFDDVVEAFGRALDGACAEAARRTRAALASEVGAQRPVQLTCAPAGPGRAPARCSSPRPRAPDPSAARARGRPCAGS